MTRFTSLVVLLAAAGCSTPHMVLPSGIAANTEMIEATDRSSWSGALADESFKLGPYTISDVDRDWNSTRAMRILDFSSEKTGGGYAYKIQRGATSMPGGCVTESGKKAHELGGGISMEKTFAKLGCTCGGEGSGVKVVIAARTGTEYGGEFTTRKATYQISAIYEAEGVLSTGDPMGYRVDADTAIGAVEVLKPGRAYFKKGLDPEEHADFACLYAGLMLYEVPRDR